MQISEVQPTPEQMERLIKMSADWENENSCRGYRKNTPEDLAGCRIFLAVGAGEPVGYLLARMETAERASSVMEQGTRFLEIEELYVVPNFRGQGIGGKLYRFAAETGKREGVEYVRLSTATKDYRRILHFYLDALGMDFWSATLFQKLE